MSAGQSQSLAKTDLWWAYRRAFEDFSKSVEHVQTLSARPCPDRAAMEAALLEVEKARLFYNRCRDALAQQLLRTTSAGRNSAPLPPDSPQVRADRIRGIAELLWEVSGKPEGTAEDDWYRAEDILRRATAV
jgi:hypothetical protein